MMIWLMISAILIALVALRGSSLPTMIISATVTTVCYVGILIFLTLTIVNSVKRELH